MINSTISSAVARAYGASLRVTIVCGKWLLIAWFVMRFGVELKGLFCGLCPFLVVWVVKLSECCFQGFSSLGEIDFSGSLRAVCTWP